MKPLTPEEKNDFALDNLRFELEFMDDLNLLNALGAVSYDFNYEMQNGPMPNERRRYLKARYGILQNEILERMSGKRALLAAYDEMREAFEAFVKDVHAPGNYWQARAVLAKAGG